MARILTLALFALFVLPASSASAADPKLELEDKSNPVVLIKTNMGDIYLELFAKEAPKTVENFIGLAEGTKTFTDPKTNEDAKRPYYDGLVFHRVIKNFMIQGGCPLGTGSGGPGYKFEDECKAHRRHDKPGILSMANAGAGTNGSQFFITHLPTPHLDGKHTVFGEVTEGQDVVNAIQGGDTIDSITIHGSTDELFEAQKDRITEWAAALG